jgi:two-component sensor histidine kinase
LASLVHEVIAPLTGEADERARIEGPAVALDPRAALSLTMALNELITNAAKYGALSSATGLLSVQWKLEDEVGRKMLQLEWQEREGPAVRPPTRRGLGTRLMERCIERDLDGDFDLVFEPEGVRCLMAIPYGR